MESSLEICWRQRDNQKKSKRGACAALRMLSMPDNDKNYINIKTYISRKNSEKYGGKTENKLKMPDIFSKYVEHGRNVFMKK